MRAGGARPRMPAPRGPRPRSRTRRNSGPSLRARMWCTGRGARVRAAPRLILHAGFQCCGAAAGARRCQRLAGNVRPGILVIMLAKRVMPAVTIPRESSETFRQLVEDVQDVAIFMLDGAGRVSTWNSGAERIKGYRAEEIVGQHFSRFYPPEAVAEGKPARLLALAAREGREEDEGWRVRKDGTRFWANSVISPMRDSQGGLIGYAKVTRDLTQRRRADQALAQTNQELERFSYSVSHDLRAPLRAINGYAQALWEDHAAPLDDEGKRLLGVIRDSAKLGGQLIDGLLNFSRVGRQALTKAPVDLTALAESVMAELRQTQGSVAVEVLLSPLPPTSGDAALLRHVLVNLIGNAFKFSAKRAHPKVEIGAEQNGSEVAYYVKDNGVGFDMQYANKLFGVFQRLHRPEEFEGTGAGLALG